MRPDQHCSEPLSAYSIGLSDEWIVKIGYHPSQKQEEGLEEKDEILCPHSVSEKTQVLINNVYLLQKSRESDQGDYSC